MNAIFIIKRALTVLWYNPFFETRKARAVFYGRLQVYAGIELGQPITESESDPGGLVRRRLRFCAASVHNLPAKKTFII